MSQLLGVFGKFMQVYPNWIQSLGITQLQWVCPKYKESFENLTSLS